MSEFVEGFVVGGVIGAVVGGKVVFDKTAEFYKYDQQEIITYYKDLAKSKEEAVKTKVDETVHPIRTKLSNLFNPDKEETTEQPAEATEAKPEEPAAEETPEVEKVSGDVVG